jgi:hypothetical protein
MARASKRWTRRWGAPLFTRCDAGEPAICPGKRARFAKADPERNLRHWKGRLEQEICGSLHPAHQLVTMGRNAERLFEDACKMISAKPCDHRQSCQRNSLRGVSVDKFGDKLLLPNRQTTALRRRMQDVALPAPMVSSIGKQMSA